MVKYNLIGRLTSASYIWLWINLLVPSASIMSMTFVEEPGYLTYSRQVSGSRNECRNCVTSSSLRSVYDRTLPLPL